MVLLLVTYRREVAGGGVEPLGRALLRAIQGRDPNLPPGLLDEVGRLVIRVISVAEDLGDLADVFLAVVPAVVIRLAVVVEAFASRHVGVKSVRGGVRLERASWSIF
jgi:hypothetical protein